MKWNEILENAAPDIIGAAVIGFGSWFAGLFKGRKEASRAVERKKEIYQPLIDDIEKYSTFDWSIQESVKTPFLKNVVDNSYKYYLGEELQDKCNYLLEIISEYNKINTKNVAHNIIVKNFEKGYEEIYGSIVDGIVHHYEMDGNEWDEEILVEPVAIMQNRNFY